MICAEITGDTFNDDFDIFKKSQVYIQYYIMYIFFIKLKIPEMLIRSKLNRIIGLKLNLKRDSICLKGGSNVLYKIYKYN